MRHTLRSLHERVECVNGSLLWRGLVDPKSGIGRVQVYAHGHPRRVTIQQVVNVGGGVRDLSRAGLSVREAAQFLNGFICASGLLLAPRKGEPATPADNDLLEKGGVL